MSAQEDITDDEFQFYKQELQKFVKEYLKLGDELDALKKAAKERAASKKEVSEKICKGSFQMQTMIEYCGLQDWLR